MPNAPRCSHDVCMAALRLDQSLPSPPHGIAVVGAGRVRAGDAMTYLQRTLVSELAHATWAGDMARRKIYAGQTGFAVLYARSAWKSACVALLILEHELTDDVTSDGVRS